jgi:hypothetical protein
VEGRLRKLANNPAYKYRVVAYGRNTLYIKAIVAYGGWHNILHAFVPLWWQFENMEIKS